MNFFDEAYLPGEPVFYAHKLDKRFKALEIIPISDVHYGNPLCSVKHLNRTIEYIQEKPNRFVVLNGDLIECVTKHSVGDMNKQKQTPQEQRDWIIDKLKPISNRILGMTTGNHENRIYKDAGFDPSKDIAKDLKAPYRPEGLMLKISFGTGNSRNETRPWTYWLYMTHGYGGARTNAAKAVKVERTSYWIHADCYVMSHDHVSNAAPVIYLMPDPRTHKDPDTGYLCGKMKAIEKKLVKSSAYLKWGGYAEQGGFSPSSLETPIIHLTNDGHGTPSVRVLV